MLTPRIVTLTSHNYFSFSSMHSNSREERQIKLCLLGVSSWVAAGLKLHVRSLDLRGVQIVSWRSSPVKQIVKLILGQIPTPPLIPLYFQDQVSTPFFPLFPGRSIARRSPKVPQGPPRSPRVPQGRRSPDRSGFVTPALKGPFSLHFTSISRTKQ